MADSSRWSHKETTLLIEAWRPLYHRQRAGVCDVWLSEKDRRRVHNTGSLVTDDWRAVATAVNGYRAEVRLQPSRTHRHCKSRIDRLRSNFGDELLARHGFMSKLTTTGDTSGWFGHGRGGLRMRSLNELATGDSRAGAGAAARVVTGAGAPAENAANGVAVATTAVEISESSSEEDPDEDPPYEPEAESSDATSEENEDPPYQPVVASSGASSEEDKDPPSEPAVTTGFFFEVPVPKKRRTGASKSTSNATPTPAVAAAAEGGRAPSVKAPASLPEMAAAMGDLHAAESNDVAVMANMSELAKDVFKNLMTTYRELAMGRVKLREKMLAAPSAAEGGAPAPEPAG